ncbi:phosphoribosyltransferase family protein [Fodinicurvata sp. EGI_FJ10296]|uniref:phosphoribosyltransferase n=1 Tax=Fodinicurvata sp. EGI_FJ10296 TaxID=3231908 RepID=UPI003454AB91
MAQFRDRDDAGRQLAEALARYSGQDAVILALPRGGVPVAARVAEALAAPLDLVLVRKIGLPAQPELAIGAVVDGDDPQTVRNESLIRATGTTEAVFAQVRDRECRENESRRHRYIGDRPRAPVAGRIAIVVDDGVATGATVRAALRAIRKQGPRELVLAVPVGAPDVIEDLRNETDTIVCLATPPDLGAIGYYYDSFDQVTDNAVIAILARHPANDGGQ